MRVEELKINYRTPKSIFDISLALLKDEKKLLREVSSIREVENSYNLITGAYQYKDIAAKYTELSKNGLGIIIVPQSLLAELSQTSLSPWVFTADQSKGVEYDFVMILEPTLILEEGFSRLYVALTRATTYLEVYTKELASPSLKPSLTK
jgi:DNA helicase IV